MYPTKVFSVAYESLCDSETIWLYDVEVVKRREKGRHDLNNKEVRKVDMYRRQSLERE
jgi:hypothetical protein